MDKTEYQIKLDEINRLVELQEYEDALEIVDTIEWKRVKSARTLCMVAEIYEINGELEESMRILQLAYKRSSLGKTVLYRQIELALKMKKYNDAVKYYNKYLEAASNDTTKYILKYKIYKAQKAPLEDLIAILEEYKEREYTERWVYELARLYKQAENQRKCVETCDDLILWFGEGKYVMKAMELKMAYVPLSVAQKAKYEQYKKEEAEKSSASVVKSSTKPSMKKVTEPVKFVKELSAEKASSVARTVVTSGTTIAPVKPTVDAVKTVKLPTDPGKAIVKTAAESTKPTSGQKKLVPPSFEHISAAARNTSQKPTNFIKKELAFVPPVLEESKELLKEAAVTIPNEMLSGLSDVETPVDVSAEKEVKVEETIDTEKVSKESVVEEEPSIESILAAVAAEIMAEKAAEEEKAEAEKAKIAVYEIPDEVSKETPVQNIVVNNEELQKNLAKSLEQVFSGLHRTKMTQSLEGFGKYLGSEIPRDVLDGENLEDYLMKELEPENSEDSIISVDLDEDIVIETEDEEIQSEEIQEEEIQNEEIQEEEIQNEEVQEEEIQNEEVQEEEIQNEEVQEEEIQNEEVQEEEIQNEEVQEEEIQNEEVQEEEIQNEEVQEEEIQNEEVQEEEIQNEEIQEEEIQNEEVQEEEIQEEEIQNEEVQEEESQSEKSLSEDLDTSIKEDNNLDIMELDLEALFAETSSDFAKMIESFANENINELEETEVETEEVPENEEESEEPQEIEAETEVILEIEKESEEPQEIQVETEVILEIEKESEEPQEIQVETEEILEIEKGSEELQEIEAETEVILEIEEETENPQETIEENSESTEFPDWGKEDELDAQAAMLAFEASLLDGLNSIPGLESYQLEEFSEETEEIPNEEQSEETEEIPNEEQSEETEEIPNEEQPEETEEVPNEEQPEETEEVPTEEQPEETEEVPTEEQPEETEETSTDELEIKEIVIEDSCVENLNEEMDGEFIEEDNGFDIDFEAQLIAEAESFLNMKENDSESEKKPDKEMDLVEFLMMEADQETNTYQSLTDETPEDKRRRILNENCQTVLSDEQKALFSYFCKVPGMNEQIVDAINGVYRYADERTSRRGNIAIMGSHGMGKTRLGEGLVKAICKQFGIQAAKYARVDALELNKKDIATVVGKMAGGFLMVERAHLMTPATIGQLATAMEFRTDSMVLIIEDEKAEMRQLLAEYPHFAEKFETVISIPVFTNDELVTFARTYAKENGFKMDELGVLALYALIGDNQREDEPVTIGRVKSMVDAAIRHATNARLGRRLSKRHVDEDGRILLYEKDFED